MTTQEQKAQNILDEEIAFLKSHSVKLHQQMNQCTSLPEKAMKQLLYKRLDQYTHDLVNDYYLLIDKASK